MHNRTASPIRTAEGTEDDLQRSPPIALPPDGTACRTIYFSARQFGLPLAPAQSRSAHAQGSQPPPSAL